MMPVLTKLQVDAVPLVRKKPLLICDVDDVVVHFLRGFEEFLAEQSLELRLRDLHLRGSIFSTSDGIAVDDPLSFELVSTFFRDRTAGMQAIDGAVDSLLRLAADAQIVLLTNLPYEAKEARESNMSDLGLPFPVIVNSGPKGPAIRALSAKAEAPAAFVDDNTGFIQSAHEYAPSVKTVHFLHDERLKRLSPILPGQRSDNWTETEQYLRAVLKPST
jgi:hypothetical protein